MPSAGHSCRASFFLKRPLSTIQSGRTTTPASISRTSEEGTSISIGYMAESYIDFGAVGMMVPIFGLGLLLGGFYRWMLRRDPSRLLGMALATATIYRSVVS